MISTGLIHNPPASSKLIASFATSKTTCVARLIAERINGLDTYTWNTIIKGYLEEKNPVETILVYAHVRKMEWSVDSYTLLYAIKACGLMSWSFGGGQIHGQIMKMGFDIEMIIVTSLVNMYGLFDDMDSAQRVFDETTERDVVLWNALVTMYAQRSYAEKALLVLRYMVKENVRMNVVTAVSVLSACSCLRALREGKQIHSYVLKNIFNIDVFVYNALLHLYSKCGSLDSAHKLFRRMPVRNVVSWTTMMNGCSDNNRPGKALGLLKEMDSVNVQPDEVTILGVISMCAKLGTFELGEWIDNYVKKNGFEGNDICMSNALINMHAKCGNIKKACQVFDQMEEKTLLSWSTMIQGLAMHGHGVAALIRFCQMQREGFRPDEIFFISLLAACSHSGLIDEGRKCFRSMIEDYDMTPGLMHYGCMVDLLCRAGLVGEAFHFVEDMPITPDVIMWRMLLGACKDQGNTSLTSKIVNRLLELDPYDSGNCVLQSNVYANAGDWDNVKDVRTEMRIKGVSKQDPGCSLIQMN
ncbi:hypothetical protein IFM89_022381 [Coptis chinensis]|uniref:Pentatricopeptide repeat-containing protein n=1 Tax=Coptis chinensis TaxID=261450 RepID=A0A835IWJ0_9MAGN|nr:hypothetical protein IFM89_022381 [Coptis chinensis]